jgi:hypothetical protein
MAVDSLLASAPLTLTRQIVEQTSQTIERVQETVDKVLLEGPDAEDQKLSQPGTQPVGASKESSESGPQGKPDGDGDADDSGNPAGSGDNETPFRGKAVNLQA